jgi:phospholipid/cholesterol/gamma-HCH transport system substrate-binding protein
MNNPSEASLSTRIKVGIFTLVGLLLIGGMTVFVNHKPYWWKPCQKVRINVEDATGLKTKSPIRSLGLEIGFLDSVELSETHVTLGICITAPVEVLPATRAYIRGEGFLGDKFVELKPIRYVGGGPTDSSAQPTDFPANPASDTPPASPSSTSGRERPPIYIQMALNTLRFFDQWVTDARAEDAEAATTASPRPSRQGREIPVGEEGQDIQHLVNRVDGLVQEMTALTSNLRQSINPEQLKNTIQSLNKALENASKTLSPQSGLNQTAQRTLLKLEDAVEQLRDQMTRINQGQGSLGKLINDPSYADEIHEVIHNANKLLNKVNDVRFVINIGGEEIAGYDGSRGVFQLSIYPKPDHYYLIGISTDPRGNRTETVTTTTPQGSPSTQVDTVAINQTGILLTGMIGKIFFHRIDLSIGALYGDGCVSQSFYLGPMGSEDRYQFKNDVYSHSGDTGISDRMQVIVRPYLGIYFKAGLETLKLVNGRTAYSYGGGVQFDDEDIKLLFALR